MEVCCAKKEPVFDFKINQSIGYVKSIQKKLADTLVKERVAINLKAEQYYLINVFLMLIWTAVLLAALINGRVAETVEVGVFCTLLGSYPLLTQYQSELSYYLSSIGKDWLIIQALQNFSAFDEVDDREEITDAIPEIIFSDVCFKYPGTDKYALRNINFTLSPGQTIALVGENGSGKSTIIKLLCGLYAPTEGTATVNGIPVCKLSQASRNKLFSSVFQDFQTYSITIAENIGLGSALDSNDERDIEHAMKKARIDAYVKSLPNGAATHLDHLDEDGVNLSGGQRQRLAIARAYMSNAHYFLLDEPTAAMDPVAESQLYQSFSEIIQGKGAVLVSHRLASAVIADRILVLHDGTIAQCGTHSDLMAVDGLYKEMFIKQSSWYTEMGADQ